MFVLLSTPFGRPGSKRRDRHIGAKIACHRQNIVVAGLDPAIHGATAPWLIVPRSSLPFLGIPATGTSGDAAL
jgi:hypothetical protein